MSSIASVPAFAVLFVLTGRVGGGATHLPITTASAFHRSMVWQRDAQCTNLCNGKDQSHVGTIPRFQ
jgi:hypothetical protein